MGRGLDAGTSQSPPCGRGQGRAWTLGGRCPQALGCGFTPAHTYTPAHTPHTPLAPLTLTHPRTPQCVPGAGSPAALHSLVEELVCFRLKVRQFALASGEAPGEARRQRLLERQPLLEACDALRRDLAVHGISIKVSALRGRAQLASQTLASLPGAHPPPARACPEP